MFRFTAMVCTTLLATAPLAVAQSLPTVEAFEKNVEAYCAYVDEVDGLLGDETPAEDVLVNLAQVLSDADAVISPFYDMLDGYHDDMPRGTTPDDKADRIRAAMARAQACGDGWQDLVNDVRVAGAYIDLPDDVAAEIDLSFVMQARADLNGEFGRIKALLILIDAKL